MTGGRSSEGRVGWRGMPNIIHHVRLYPRLSLPAIFILITCIVIMSPIAAIYNSSVRQSYVPPSWKQAEILPIPKVPQVTSLAKHLRSIALTPVLSKVLESFVVSWMREATEHSETQYGGIKDSSTTLALITMLHHVLQRLERKNTYARILLIDFSKAFDHIDHNILLDKLKSNGVPQICVDWQKAFLTRRTQRVKLANTTSDWTEMAGGVPQGTLSGPENFLNMIDDLHTDVDDVKFVDDVTLYEVCNTHSRDKLQMPWMTFRSWQQTTTWAWTPAKRKNFWFTMEEKSLISHLSPSMVMWLNVCPARSYLEFV